MRLILVKNLTQDGTVEKYFNSVPAYVPTGTIKIQKVLSSYNCYDWATNKIGTVSVSQFNELWETPALEAGPGYHIPTQVENDEAWENDPE